MPLDLFSERYSALGNISGEGLSRVLGAPTLDAHRILVREAVQNSWDARADDAVPLSRMQLRSLRRRETTFLREEVLSARPAGTAAAQRLEEVLSAETIRVLEISDFNTTGLGGPSRADVVSSADEAADFVDFVRNVGSARNKLMGGGTYGYGKSSLYRASNCSTVLIHSVARFCGKRVERFIGCQLASQYTRRDGPDPAHFTGRHWWGRLAADGVIDPAEGEDAAQLAEALGLPERRGGAFGTTILILDPTLQDRTEGQLLDLFEETLLWNFWPKMMEGRDGQPQMRFELLHNGKLRAMRRPEDFPPLEIFVEAMRALRDGQAREVRCLRPRKLLGRISFARGIRRSRVEATAREDTCPIPLRSHHVALMRPVELVVKYLEVPPLEQDAVEYGGVFVSDPGVEEVFARSEPPAHDDWVPDVLDKAHATLVRVALRRIREAAEEFIEYRRPTPGGGSGIPVGRIADELGQLLIDVGGQRVGADGRRRRKRSSSASVPARRRGWRVGTPRVSRFDIVDGLRCVWFDFEASCEPGIAAHLAAEPVIVFEGGASEAAADGSRPEVVGWWLEDVNKGKGATVELPKGFRGNVSVAVSLPGQYAIELRVRGSLSRSAEVV